MHNLRLSPGSYRTARVIVAVSGRYLAGGPKKSTRKEGQQVSKADVVQSLEIAPRHAGVPAISRLFSLVSYLFGHTAFRCRAKEQSPSGDLTGIGGLTRYKLWRIAPEYAGVPAIPRMTSHCCVLLRHTALIAPKMAGEWVATRYGRKRLGASRFSDAGRSTPRLIPHWTALRAEA